MIFLRWWFVRFQGRDQQGMHVILQHFGGRPITIFTLARLIQTILFGAILYLQMLELYLFRMLLEIDFNVLLKQRNHPSTQSRQ